MRLELTPQQTALVLWALGAAARSAPPPAVDLYSLSHTLAGGYEAPLLPTPAVSCLCDLLDAAARECSQQTPQGFSRDLHALAGSLRLAARRALG